MLFRLRGHTIRGSAYFALRSSTDGRAARAGNSPNPRTAAGQASVALSRDKQKVFMGLKNKGLDEAMGKAVPQLEKPWHHFPQRVES